MLGRRTFALRVSESRGARPYAVSMLLVSYRRGVSKLVKETPLRHARDLDEAAAKFVKLRDSVVEAGFPEWPGGHDLGPVDAASFGLRDDGLTDRGARRALKHFDRTGAAPVLQAA